MIEIALGALGVALLFYSPIPLSATRELVRPRSVYLGGAIIVLVVLPYIVKLPESINVWTSTVVPIFAIVGAILLAQVKSASTVNTSQEKSKSTRIINVITWMLLLGMLAVILLVAGYTLP